MEFSVRYCQMLCFNISCTPYSYILIYESKNGRSQHASILQSRWLRSKARHMMLLYVNSRLLSVFSGTECSLWYRMWSIEEMYDAEPKGYKFSKLVMAPGFLVSVI